MKNLSIPIVLLFFAVPAAGLASGRSDYKAHCANCHGANALLTVKTARKLGVDPRKLSLMASKMNKEEMAAIIVTGKDKMPGFEKELTKEQIAGIVDYLLESREKKIKKESLIRIKAPVTPNPDPAEPSGGEKGTAP